VGGWISFKKAKRTAATELKIRGGICRSLRRDPMSDKSGVRKKTNQEGWGGGGQKASLKCVIGQKKK